MSRIGKKEIAVPDKVDVKIGDSQVTINGPKGQLVKSVPDGIKVEREGGAVKVTRTDDEPRTRALHGLTRSLIANAIQGVSDGFEVGLEISGVGYKVSHQGKKVQFSLGYSHPIDFEIPDGIEIEADEKALTVKVKGIDKEQVGQVAANIRKLRSPSPYSFRGKFMGVKLKSERLKLRQGKTGA